MTNLELIEQHQKDTGFCSFFHHMRSASSTYKQIIENGNEIIPDILKYMQDNPDNAGMSIMLLLWDITKESPYQPEKIGDTGFGGYKVSDAKQAWIEWGKEKKLI